MSTSPLWILVGGPHRSGTTFLVDLLNSHPQVGIFNEFPIDELVTIPELYFKFEEQIRPVREARERGFAAPRADDGGADRAPGQDSDTAQAEGL